MFRKVVKFSLLSLMAVVAGAPFLMAQTVEQVNNSADEVNGNYQPMNLGYAGFNSLGMTQSAWLDPMQNLGEGQSRPAYSKYYWTPDLVLPVRLRELVTRVSLAIRRAYPSEYAAAITTVGPFVFSRYPNRVMRDGKEIVLTAREFELALLLFTHIGQPLSRLTLEETVWPDNANESSRTVDTHVSRVRNKLGLHEASGFCLQQVYGYGYRLVPA